MADRGLARPSKKAARTTPAKRRPATAAARRAGPAPAAASSQPGLVFFLSAVAIVSFGVGYRIGLPGSPASAHVGHHASHKALAGPAAVAALAGHPRSRALLSHPHGLSLPPERRPSATARHEAPSGPPSSVATSGPAQSPGREASGAPAGTPVPSVPAPRASTEASPSVPAPDASNEASPSAAPAPHVVGRAAIIIDDFGNNYEDAEGFIHARVPLTLSVLPQLPYTVRIAEEGKRFGKTIMLHLPMEPLSNKNPGPGTVRTAMTDAEITRLVATNMAAVPNIEGVNNHEGSKATQDARVMRLVLQQIHDRRLFYVDSMTTMASQGPDEARRLGVPYTVRNVFLDNEDDDDRIREQLKLLLADARAHGTAVGIGHVRIRTLRCILAMAPTFEAEGIKLVSIKDLVKEP